MPKYRFTNATFVGKRNKRLEKPVTVLIVSRNYSRPLKHVKHHSPTGFEYGYGGSGPADLALSILDALIDEPRTVPVFRGLCGELAWELHQKFKRKFIEPLTGDGPWEITAEQVMSWIES